MNLERKKEGWNSIFANHIRRFWNTFRSDLHRCVSVWLLTLDFKVFFWSMTHKQGLFYGVEVDPGSVENLCACKHMITLLFSDEKHFSGASSGHCVQWDKTLKQASAKKVDNLFTCDILVVSPRVQVLIAHSITVHSFMKAVRDIKKVSLMIFFRTTLSSTNLCCTLSSDISAGSSPCIIEEEAACCTTCESQSVFWLMAVNRITWFAESSRGVTTRSSTALWRNLLPFHGALMGRASFCCNSVCRGCV